MKWHKVYLRKMTEEEKEFYQGDFDEIWDGDIPEIGQKVLVTYPLACGWCPTVDIDTWEEIGDGLGFEINTEYFEKAKERIRNVEKNME